MAGTFARWTSIVTGLDSARAGDRINEANQWYDRHVVAQGKETSITRAGRDAAGAIENFTGQLGSLGKIPLVGALAAGGAALAVAAIPGVNAGLLLTSAAVLGGVVAGAGGGVTGVFMGGAMAWSGAIGAAIGTTTLALSAPAIAAGIVAGGQFDAIGNAIGDAVRAVTGAGPLKYANPIRLASGLAKALPLFGPAVGGVMDSVAEITESLVSAAVNLVTGAAAHTAGYQGYRPELDPNGTLHVAGIEKLRDGLVGNNIGYDSPAVQAAQMQAQQGPVRIFAPADMDFSRPSYSGYGMDPSEFASMATAVPANARHTAAHAPQSAFAQNARTDQEAAVSYRG